ncbi:phospholipid-translocating P-type ATPase, flippase [Dictyocaulus viviparus]|uniref:Phospholipid-transporting ATPase n=1 Tax=Dictyocaulus viviparus TaxID=29172 RepID=A0A0D8XT62_DICVI|nr:phospholipid-translocating P-type ATPase, flippase [Dictyocaulus viviparus]
MYRRRSHTSVRQIHISCHDARNKHKFCSNEIRCDYQDRISSWILSPIFHCSSTCKYNGFSFLPRFLYEQFRRYNNIFFLTIAVLQQIPDVSPTGRYTTALPFILILSVSALKEIFEDIKRRRSDSKVNSFDTMVLENDGWSHREWREVLRKSLLFCFSEIAIQIAVGDVVRVDNDQLFPADLMLLASSEPQSMCYIETSNLDGETNLKIKQALPITSSMTTLEKISNFEAYVECELPSRHVNEFSGNLIYQDESFPFGIDQLLLRGARLKNTSWIFGVAIYTGHDAKLLMNSKTAPLKNATVDLRTNNYIILLFFVLIALAIVSATGAEFWRNFNLADAWYLSFLQVDKRSSLLWNVLTFFILYNNLIPISLQVTLEIVRFFQAGYINVDMEMYDINSDSCAIARTSNLNEELGLVKFLMSDKTGTLTRNVMKFKRVSVAGQIFGDNETDEFSDEKLINYYRNEPVSANGIAIRELLIMMAACHTVVPEKKDGMLSYQCTSPDEGALVRGAAAQGFVFHTRQPQKIVIAVLGIDEEFEVLDVIDFTSDRKRMSVIVRDKTGVIKLYTKGADTVVLERLVSGSEAIKDRCREHLEIFASYGYRTLCFAMRIIDEVEYHRWSKEYRKAGILIEGRQKALAVAAEKIEAEMELVGATAIEDKLQEFVPETVQALMAADIRVWMLTGDKRETAINIAHSCALCNQYTELLTVDKETYEETSLKLVQLVERSRQLLEENKEFAMVIDGKSLTHALVGECRLSFGELALACRSVVCCRMSPMQKAEVVEMVRSLGNHVVMAVGDGANDVAMIQASNVGVGISGEEGLQASSASDYAIPRFHFLRRLLLVHGALNHDRSVKVILYSFYKNICLYIIELWFAIFSAFSGQTIFERWTIGLFNVIFTAWPPVALGLFDRPVDCEQMMKHPSLYYSFQKQSFSVMRFLLWIGIALLHSLSLFFLSYGFLDSQVVWFNGRTGGWVMFGNSAYTFVVATVCLKALLECDSWTWPMVFASIGSISLWLIFLWIYAAVFPIISVRFGADMSGMAWIMMSSSLFWFALLFIPSATLLWDLVIKSICTIVAPTLREQAVMSSKNSGTSLGFERIASKPSRIAVAKTPLSQMVGVTKSSSHSLQETSRLHGHDNPALEYGSTEMVTYSSTVLENVRLLRDSMRVDRQLSDSSLALAEQARYGYAFSQEEDGAIAQTELVRCVDSTTSKPTGL